MDSSELFNITDDEDSLIEGIPTVVVGWERAKKFNENSNIIEWKTDDLTYWVFSKRENNSKYTEKLKEFKELAIKRFLKSIKYSFFNILTAETEEKSEFCKKFLNGKSYFVSNNEILYSYNEDENCVYGLSLLDIAYEGGDISKIINRISSTGNIIRKAEDVPFSIKNMIGNSTYALPYIYSE